MKKLLILTDSSTSMSLEQAKKYDVEILPLTITRNDGKEYIEEILHLKPSDIISMLDNGHTFKTSCTPIGYMETLISDKLKEYEYILAMPISSGWSSQYSHLKSLEEMFDNKFIVADTNTYGYELELIAKEVRAKVEKNPKVDINELKEFVESYHNHSVSYIGIKNVDGIIASGRVPKIVTKLVKLTKVYPLLRYDKINHLETVMKKWDQFLSKSMNAFNKIFDDFDPSKDIKNLAILISNNTKEEINNVKERLIKEYSIAESKIKIVHAPIVLHTVVWNEAIGLQVVTNKVKKSI